MQPRTRLGPVALNRSRRDTKRARRFLLRQPREESQFDHAGQAFALDAEPRQRIINRDQVVEGNREPETIIGDGEFHGRPTTLERATTTCVVDQHLAHRASGQRQEVLTINRPRPVAGMLFFNDEGDEVGGLTFTGTDDNGRRANAGMMFDQLKQDQTIGISYSEGNGQRSAGLQVWDRSERPLSELIKALNDANALPEGPARDAAVKAVRAKAPPGPRRLFVGKNTDKASTVSLADGQGRPRLIMRVDEDGAASIEFLDAEGKSVRRYGPSN